jgi:hypothetical protein
MGTFTLVMLSLEESEIGFLSLLTYPGTPLEFISYARPH